MTGLRSTVDTSSPAYTEAASAMSAKLAELDASLAKALSGGGSKYLARHHARGKLTARERIELLVDEDSPFLELCPLAAYGTDFQVGASVVIGIGVVEGTECMLVANDPTVKGRHLQPVDSEEGAARQPDCLREPTTADITGGVRGRRPADPEGDLHPGGQMFRDLTRLSAAGIPTIALVFGNSTAGGAYIPGMSDYVVMIKGTLQGVPGRATAGQDGNRRGV